MNLFSLSKLSELSEDYRQTIEYLKKSDKYNKARTKCKYLRKNNQVTFEKIFNQTELGHAKWEDFKGSIEGFESDKVRKSKPDMVEMVIAYLLAMEIPDEQAVSLFILS